MSEGFIYWIPRAGVRPGGWGRGAGGVAGHFAPAPVRPDQPWGRNAARGDRVCDRAGECRGAALVGHLAGAWAPATASSF